ncbi:methyl-accepting chemotaxis protein [Piscirickettsia salmonis]|uniref:Methyl-accepting chemotaxis protein McpB n=2 Tax=Piscirickettsia salmonis TaxID=1238 RepID=A0A9Q6PY61_PISSA|nr:HAMP domain-containing methyl-accepting chemotaxis protein [Piscirickettsia salmonis]ALA23886.1 methyl-accepting chemotaxis (MCP) signaling domain protein [Piscirickettsia salmonis]QGN78588.1 Methyl-accepting chemotaxis protein McpB [Piscirickettsia salmonis]QGN82171.1 Methyl-accepting chemotaxis protein McpB [Piscirickettsia salmonis]QGN83558.1 Methyl-accepting chemotaxis protein McpB [Piscirickettsia salmonis]QGN87071.1 Methyl-accepting chemotaxis protein McpB [Piscirickettsia salmonis]
MRMSASNLNSLTIKLLGISSIAAFLIVSAGFYGLSSSWSSMNELSRIIEVDQAHERSVLKISVKFKEQVQEWKNILLRGYDRKKFNKYLEKFKDKEKQVAEESTTLLQELQGPSNKTAHQLLATFIKDHKVLAEKYRQGLRQFEASGYDSKTGDKAVSGIDRVPLHTLTTTADTISKQLATTSQAALKKKQQVVLFTLVLIIVAIIAGAATYAILVRRLIIRRVHLLVSDLEHITEGDFTHQCQPLGEDEIGKIGTAIETLKNKMGALISEINLMTQQVNNSSATMSNMMREAQVQLTEQASEAEHIQSSMTAMNDTMKTVVSKAEEVAKSARDADQKSHEGQKVVNATRETIDSLAKEVETTAQVITSLNEASNNVGSILDVIKGISEQTNMLALNAAIEAARAGEQGRGFAVVADEVRGLAQRTGDSAEQIYDLIEQLRSHAHNAVEAMDKGKERADASVQQSEKMSELLTSIITIVSEISATNAQIESLIKEQSNSFSVVTQQVSKINTLSKNTTAKTGETTVHSQELSELSESLSTLLKQFKLTSTSLTDTSSSEKSAH